MKKKHIIIGIRGQIGMCVHTFLREVGEGDVVGVDRDGYGNGVMVEGKHYGNDDGSGYDYDMMHVCIPFVSPEQFVNTVKGYMRMYLSKYVIVYSTVLPGTCRVLGEGVCHSPVEGRHPRLIDGFRTFTRFVSGKHCEAIGEFYKYYGLEVKLFERCEVTELGKMLSTTRYGINMLFAAEQEMMCRSLGLDFQEVVLAYQRMYNEGYDSLNEQRFMQAMVVPPGETIGGHCVVPNAQLLLSMFTGSAWVRELAEYNNTKSPSE